MKQKETVVLLDTARQFHDRLAVMYAQLANKTRDEKMRILLEFLQKRENRLKSMLTEYENVSPEEERPDWYRFAPEDHPLAKMDRAVFDPRMSVKDLIGKALELNNVLIDWYDGIAKDAVPGIKEVFQDLADLERNESKELARDMQGFDQQA